MVIIQGWTTERARTVEATRTSAQFYAPGPIVEAQILRPEHPIFYGYTPSVVPVRWASGPLLRVGTEDRRSVRMQFPGTDRSVLSGLMRGVAETRNRPAVIDMPVGGGHVVMFATADWDWPYWTNKQHTAALLGDRGYRVLYVDSVGLRPPGINAVDLRRLARRLWRWLRGSQKGAWKRTARLAGGAEAGS